MKHGSGFQRSLALVAATRRKAGAAAGIDVGNAEHCVAIGADRDEEPVRKFGCFTEDLRRMADWLVERGIRTVAMQSTGVY